MTTPPNGEKAAMRTIIRIMWGAITFVASGWVMWVTWTLLSLSIFVGRGERWTQADGQRNERMIEKLRDDVDKIKDQLRNTFGEGVDKSVNKE